MKSTSTVSPLLFLLLLSTALAEPAYKWQAKKPGTALAQRIKVPAGFTRIKAADDSWQTWLQKLPLKPSGSAVFLHNGSKKANQKVHAAVIDIDTGKRNLQQCADAVIRLRAEHLLSVKKANSITFNFTSGDKASWISWASGYRPIVKGNKVSWVKKGKADHSYRNFKRYLQTVFIYAGSYSLSKELQKRKSVKDMQIGDVFIQGGFPGHAVIVVDMATNPKNGKKVFLLAQSYMPAQDIHILKNPNSSTLSPWYSLDFGKILKTPEWTFKSSDLKHFK